MPNSSSNVEKTSYNDLFNDLVEILNQSDFNNFRLNCYNYFKDKIAKNGDEELNKNLQELFSNDNSLKSLKKNLTESFYDKLRIGINDQKIRTRNYLTAEILTVFKKAQAEVQAQAAEAQAKTETDTEKVPPQVKVSFLKNLFSIIFYPFIKLFTVFFKKSEQGPESVSDSASLTSDQGGNGTLAAQTPSTTDPIFIPQKGGLNPLNSATNSLNTGRYPLLHATSSEDKMSNESEQSILDKASTSNQLKI